MKKINPEKFTQENLLGQPGGEKSVYEDPDNPDLAIGIFHDYRKETPRQVKARFYLTKTLNLLFPRNIPDIHMVSSHPHAIIVDRVGDSEEQPNYLKMVRLQESFEALGIHLDKNAPTNFKCDKDGNVVYVDSFRPWSLYQGELFRWYDSKGLRKALEELKDEEQRELGRSYLHRLDELLAEEERNLID